MSKQDVIKDGQEYANVIQQDVLVQRRGDVYKASVILHKGWKLAEVLKPEVKNA